MKGPRGRAFQLIISAVEHYLPFLYVLGLKVRYLSDRKELVKLFNDRTVMGSIAMTSVMVG